MQRLLWGVGALALGLCWLSPAPRLPAAAKKEDKKDKKKGWVQLFNGKDLKGWKTHPKDKAKWEVKDGLLVGSGPAGHLFSERGDYVNFRYRVVAMINDKGNSGQ